MDHELVPAGIFWMRLINVVDITEPMLIIITTKPQLFIRSSHHCLCRLSIVSVVHRVIYVVYVCEVLYSIQQTPQWSGWNILSHTCPCPSRFADQGFRSCGLPIAGQSFALSLAGFVILRYLFFAFIPLSFLFFLDIMRTFSSRVCWFLNFG